MAFNFDELTRKAKDVANKAADRTKDAAELVKLNVAIAGEQKEIDKNYRAIGEWFVGEYEGEIPDAVREKSPPGPWKRLLPERSAPFVARSPTVSSAPSAARPWASEK